MQNQKKAEQLSQNNNSTATESNFFNADQLLKFATGLDSDLKDPLSQFEMNFDLTESNNYYDLNNADLPNFNDLKLSEDLMKDAQYTSLNDKKCSSSNSEDAIMGLIKNTISPSDSTQYDSLSLSSDSGCRSNSFVNDEDSAIASVQCSSISKKTKKIYDDGISKKSSEECTISEHLEFTCSNSSPMNPDEVKDEDEDDGDDNDDCSSDCDTSDDASEIPTDGDADCLNDLDLLDENFLNGNDEFIEEESNRYNQVIDKDGTVIRKKLENGTYKSINQTLSLFIEPHDILKQIDQDEYDEYSLFPSEYEQTVDSYLVIKNHFYLSY